MPGQWIRQTCSDGTRCSPRVSSSSLIRERSKLTIVSFPLFSPSLCDAPRKREGSMIVSLLSRLEEAIMLHGRRRESCFLEWIVVNFKMAVDQSPLLAMHWYSCVYMHKWSYTGYACAWSARRLRDVHLNHSSRLIDSVSTLRSKWNANTNCIPF